jgi:hypothetical protein
MLLQYELQHFLGHNHLLLPQFLNVLLNGITV